MTSRVVFCLSLRPSGLVAGRADADSGVPTSHFVGAAEHLAIPDHSGLSSEHHRSWLDSGMMGGAFEDISSSTRDRGFKGSL